MSQTTNDQYDSPWKEILEGYFPDFLGFFFPATHGDVDWGRGYESLDHELQQVVRDAELGRRLADKLMKVHRLDGEEQWVLIHTEIQGERDEDFPERMFTYNYRLYDRYRRPVVSLAVLGDDHATWRPNRFGYELWGCRMGLSFPVVKLSDFEQHWPELEASANPFATVVMAHLQTRKTRRAPEARYQWKMRLVRRLYECGFERQDVLELFRFIDWVMALPPELEGRFNVEYRKIEEELEMRYITTVERHGIEQGRQEGLQQGVEKGLREGVEKGLRQGVEKGQREGEAALLRRLLLRRFEQLPSWAEERLDEANREQIESWSDRLFEAEQLEDVFGSTR